MVIQGIIKDMQQSNPSEQENHKTAFHKLIISYEQ
jgi:hypothetical protein